MSTLVFVYGTLQSGRSNNHFLDGQKFIGPATTIGRFDLFDGGFPRMADGSAGCVTGELWRVDAKALDMCDQLEGHPRWYKRRIIRVRDHANGKNVNAWAYIMPRKLCNGYPLVKLNNLGYQAWGRRTS